MKARGEGPLEGAPDLDDVRRMIASSRFAYRKLKGLDLAYVPPDLEDETTRAYYRDLVKREKTGRPFKPEDLLRMADPTSPLWGGL